MFPMKPNQESLEWLRRLGSISASGRAVSLINTCTVGGVSLVVRLHVECPWVASALGLCKHGWGNCLTTARLTTTSGTAVLFFVTRPVLVCLFFIMCSFLMNLPSCPSSYRRLLPKSHAMCLMKAQSVGGGGEGGRVL